MSTVEFESLTSNLEDVTMLLTVMEKLVSLKVLASCFIDADTVYLYRAAYVPKTNNQIAYVTEM